jgi:hypothetical protein
MSVIIGATMNNSGCHRAKQSIVAQSVSITTAIVVKAADPTHQKISPARKQFPHQHEGSSQVSSLVGQVKCNKRKAREARYAFF